ncbi:GSCFA domain-containing protein [Brumimicrobium aurantiacum]|uniref:GSCFA domain-containing protein n=1 Tax=Brumimicrobium aurantiacum TaxID=1737063 RepID=A0A3E1EUG0_9FLAO|nr:GSCFA domain-containing protein [Brumimicrobium aurantiacum]RFC53168.1 hypothetical protein DXU93_14505 [Brumimicrobium aurantiacum]
MQKTSVKIPKVESVDYASHYSFLGSCFSEHLSAKMKENGFTVSANPFGVIFNPISLADLLLGDDEVLEDSVFERDGVALSWLANSTCFTYAEKTLKTQLVELRKEFLNSLSSSKILFVTFGTAWVYEKNSTHQIVANCHKVPNKNFTKRLLTVEEITEKWSQLIEKLNLESDLKLIFTVSPVRHVKDGLVENARSKAVLLNAVHKLNDKYSNVGYFPAYELMLDEMRDYAFYKKDGLHPNEIAVDEIWKRFKEAYFTEQTDSICKEYEKIRMLFAHRSLHPASEKAKEFELNREKKLEDFKLRFPSFNRGGR